MTVKVGCIVEGHGDVVAVPLLIRRIAAELHPDLVIETPRPIRVQRNQIVQADKFERRVELAAQRIGGQGSIFIILDADDSCPAQLGPELLNRASQVRSDLPIAVVLAKYEFEAWFLASAESLRGQRGLRDNIQPPNDPETIRGAKEWLTHRMEGSRTYSETHDQPALAALFDIDKARQVDSFDKCYREIVRLLEELQKASDPIQ
ncbi:hypothetical protein C6500_15275 [Candidatus Poribacteria bacterium]|nr:MAG: hypothetical protein C6500_15275 [Candidatus Poribacteria bacterium]